MVGRKWLELGTGAAAVAGVALSGWARVAHADAIGFDGQQVVLGVYAPTIAPTNILSFAEATVVPGVVTFPSISSTEFTPNNNVVNADVSISGSVITFNYPTSEAGVTFGTASFNGYVFTTYTPTNVPASITGISLLGTNISGLAASDLSFSANTLDVNVAGLSLPSSGAGAIEIGATFGVPPVPAPPPQLMAPAKSAAQQQYYKNLIGAYNRATLVFGAATFTPCDDLCALLSISFAYKSSQLANMDPLDFDYQNIVASSYSVSPPLPIEQFLTPETTSLFNDIQNSDDQIGGIINAAYTSLNRASGAFVSGNAQYELLQLNAVNTYISEEMAVSTEIGNDLVQLGMLLPMGTGLDDAQLVSLGNQFIDAGEITSQVPEPPSLIIFSGALGANLLYYLCRSVKVRVVRRNTPNKACLIEA